jgi:hypothetical protein
MEYKGVAKDLSINIVLDIIKQPFIFPGGYEKVAITEDGATICCYCVKDYFKKLPKNFVRMGFVENFKDRLYCDYCGLLLNPDGEN